MSSTSIDGFTVRPLITVTARDGGFCFDVNVADGLGTYTGALDAHFR